jgi:2-phosphosulfolactate phosphatase
VTPEAANGTVVIDCFAVRAAVHADAHAIVAVDVLRATTTAVTGVAMGRRCFPVPSLELAVPLAARLSDPLLVGELGGNAPYGFGLTNSPAELARRRDVERDMILLSTSGTRLICEAPTTSAVYVACLRNVRAQVAHLAERYQRVAVISAGTRGEFREEDQLCCAWIAEGLIAAGYRAVDEHTQQLVQRWSGRPAEALTCSKSVDFLRDTGQMRDLEFVLSHVDDLAQVFRLEGGQIVRVQP